MKKIVEKVSSLLMNKFGTYTIINFDVNNWDDYTLEEIFLFDDNERKFLIKKGIKLN